MLVEGFRGGGEGVLQTGPMENEPKGHRQLSVKGAVLSNPRMASPSGYWLALLWIEVVAVKLQDAAQAADVKKRLVTAMRWPEDPTPPFR